MNETPRLIRTVVWYLAIPFLIAVNWFLFRRFAPTGYFVWYLKNGSIISLATGFLGLFWDLEKRKELISLDPVEYFSTCIKITGGFLVSLGTHLRTPNDEQQKTSLKTIAPDLWDNFASLSLVPIVVVLVILWVLVVAPLNYLLTLISGAPARRALRHQLRRAVAFEEGNQLSVEEWNPKAPLPSDVEDVSFARKPFATTQAVNALVLWVASEIYSRFA